MSFKLGDPLDLERMAKTGYRYILMDTCFVVKEIDSLARLCDPSFIKSSGRVPSLCDFTLREFRSLSGSGGKEAAIMNKIVRERSFGMGHIWRKYQRMIDSGGVVITIDTGVSSRAETNRLIHELDRGYRRLILSRYSGHRSRGNPYDLALAAVAILLASSGVKSGVATTDRRLLELARELGGECGLDMEVWSRPWL